LSDGLPDGLAEAFDQSIEAQQTHLKIARSLIAKGLTLMNATSLDVDDLAKAAGAIDRGTKMETRANEELRKLLRDRPR
jgi:hypothetical protein